VLFTFISNILLQKGQVVYEIWGIIVTEEGLRAGGHLALRLFMLILGAKIITATTSAEELVSAMIRLLGPPGKWKPVREFISTLSLTLSFLPIIYDEAQVLYRDTVRTSSKITLLDKIKLSASLLSPLFERSMKRARDLTDIRNSDQ
jgi:energy-coupling factor transporter transmembrane protein EcfT